MKGFLVKCWDDLAFSVPNEGQLLHNSLHLVLHLSVSWMNLRLFTHILLPSCSQQQSVSFRRRSETFNKTWYRSIFHCIPSCALSVFHPAFFHPLCRPTQLTHGQMTKTCVCLLEAVPTWTCWPCSSDWASALPLQMKTATQTQIYSSCFQEHFERIPSNVAQTFASVPGDGLITIRRSEVKGQGHLVNPFFHTTLEFTCKFWQNVTPAVLIVRILNLCEKNPSSWTLQPLQTLPFRWHQMLVCVFCGGWVFSSEGHTVYLIPNCPTLFFAPVFPKQMPADFIFFKHSVVPVYP